jgi:hypothetical protein
MSALVAFERLEAALKGCGLRVSPKELEFIRSFRIESLAFSQDQLEYRLWHVSAK